MKFSYRSLPLRNTVLFKCFVIQLAVLAIALVYAVIVSVLHVDGDGSWDQTSMVSWIMAIGCFVTFVSACIAGIISALILLIKGKTKSRRAVALYALGPVVLYFVGIYIIGAGWVIFTTHQPELLD
jgi:MFS family permease